MSNKFSYEIISKEIRYLFLKLFVFITIKYSLCALITFMHKILIFYLIIT